MIQMRNVQVRPQTVSVPISSQITWVPVSQPQAEPQPQPQSTTFVQPQQPPQPQFQPELQAAPAASLASFPPATSLQAAPATSLASFPPANSLQAAPAASLASFPPATSVQAPPQTPTPATWGPVSSPMSTAPGSTMQVVP